MAKKQAEPIVVRIYSQNPDEKRLKQAIKAVMNYSPKDANNGGTAV